jgi:hypothetical protein
VEEAGLVDLVPAGRDVGVVGQPVQEAGHPSACAS